MRSECGAGALTASQRSALDRVRTVLILCTHGIGDVLMALPALQALVERAGAERVEVLVRGSTEASIVERALPGVRTTRISDIRGVGRLRWTSSVRRRGSSVCIATFNVASGPARWVVRLVGAEWSIGFSRSERKPFDVTLWPVGVHKMEENNRLMAALGIDAAARPYRWVVSPAEARVAEARLPSAQRTYIAVTPGSNPRERFKRWPPKMYADLLDRLSQDDRVACVIVGGPSDVAVAQEIRGGVPAERRARVVDLTGKLTLAESAAVLARCAVVVGGDCGLTHLGAALGRNVVVLAGPTRPEVTLPFGPSVTQLRSGHYCTGCYEKRLRIDPDCPRPACMEWHRPEVVAMHARAAAGLLTPSTPS